MVFQFLKISPTTKLLRNRIRIFGPCFFLPWRHEVQRFVRILKFTLRFISSFLRLFILFRILHFSKLFCEWFEVQLNRKFRFLTPYNELNSGKKQLRLNVLFSNHAVRNESQNHCLTSTQGYSILENTGDTSIKIMLICRRQPRFRSETIVGSGTRRTVPYFA